MRRAFGPILATVSAVTLNDCDVSEEALDWLEKV